jgi:hypothetical protein
MLPAPGTDQRMPDNFSRCPGMDDLHARAGAADAIFDRS